MTTIAKKTVLCVLVLLALACSSETGPAPVAEGRIGETPEERSPAATQRAVVKFSSDPTGAVVLLDGKLLCQSTPCSETVTAGRHKVSMQAKQYVGREETLAIKRGSKVTWKLKPDFGWVTVESAPSGLDVKVDGKAGIDWVYSKPAGLYFAKSETTLSQYEACVKAGQCDAKHHKTKSNSKYCNWGHSGRGDHPMNCVDWYGADAFCKWAGGRLPTEDEWYAEASNGGSREYAWGDERPSCERCIMDDGSTTGSAGNKTLGCGEDHTWPVCSKPSGKSVSGLCDVTGNVWEWTSSWYDSDSAKRVLRGGSWYYGYPETLRASARFRYDPGVRHFSLGFRCVRSSQ